MLLLVVLLMLVAWRLRGTLGWPGRLRVEELYLQSRKHCLRE